MRSGMCSGNAIAKYSESPIARDDRDEDREARGRRVDDEEPERRDGDGGGRESRLEHIGA
jgi:hypothetical protein